MYQVFAVILALLAALAVWETLYIGWVYNWVARRKGCGAVRTFTAFPFGIPMIIREIKANKSLQTLENVRKLVSETSTVMVEGPMKQVLLTRDPENIKYVMGTNHTDFNLGLRVPLLKPIIGKGIFVAEGAHWKISRTMLRPMFLKERISQLHMIETHLQELFALIDRESGDSRTPSAINIQARFTEFTMDTALHFLFGAHHNSFARKSDDAIFAHADKGSQVSVDQLVFALNEAGEYMALRRSMGPVGILYSPPKFREHIRTINRFSKQIVEENLNREKKVGAGATGSQNEDESFVQQMLQHTQDPDFIRDQALSVFLAGRTTTANTLSFTLLELGRNPALYDKLRDVVLQEIGANKEDVTYNAVKSCQYLNWVIQETLRIHTLVPMNLRVSSKGLKLPRGGGADESLPTWVPKGTPVLLCVDAMQRSKDFWGPDAEAYRPERWEGASPPAWTHTPFGGGPRICIGQMFALAEIGYVLARLVQTYEHMEAGPVAASGAIGPFQGVSVRPEPEVDVRLFRQTETV